MCLRIFPVVVGEQVHNIRWFVIFIGTSPCLGIKTSLALCVCIMIIISWVIDVTKISKMRELHRDDKLQVTQGCGGRFSDVILILSPHIFSY